MWISRQLTTTNRAVFNDGYGIKPPKCSPQNFFFNFICYHIKQKYCIFHLKRSVTFKKCWKGVCSAPDTAEGAYEATQTTSLLERGQPFPNPTPLYAFGSRFRHLRRIISVNRYEFFSAYGPENTTTITTTTTTTTTVGRRMVVAQSNCSGMGVERRSNRSRFEVVNTA